MTPHEVTTLLHIFITPLELDNVNAPATQEALKNFSHSDLIRRDSNTESGFSISDRGRAFIKLLMNTPYPVVEWTDPRTGEKVI